MRKINIPAGSDVSAGTFRCTKCEYEIRMKSSTSIPPCPKCKNGEWESITGVGDAVEDPYP